MCISLTGLKTLCKFTNYKRQRIQIKLEQNGRLRGGNNKYIICLLIFNKLSLKRFTKILEKN
jgi:hypothetical protein